MKPIHTFTVTPSLPEPLEPLRKIAYNLRWAWNHDTIELFRRLDNALWESSGHNPARMLGQVEQARLKDAVTDEGFMAHLDRVERHLEGYLTAKSTWFERVHQFEDGGRPLAAYFSAEFGITECLEIFAGGLGVLAGDHLKSSSDLGVPLVGVGLLYQEGYFRQYLNDAGWQQEVREDNDFYNLPLTLERDQEGSPLTVQVPSATQSIHAQIWRAQVGRVPLYLLDTNVPANADPDDRDVTDELYGGDHQLRIRQEIMLGIGGYRALEALGLEPLVYHLNEGHPAFMALERIRHLMESQELSFDQAREATSASLVFTTHTPVPAGHDYFSPELVLHYLKDYARGLGLSDQAFLDLGRDESGEEKAPFCMTTLALRLASRSNAVSQLHGRVTRHMWRSLWPDVPQKELPIAHVTNGVNFRSWISLEMNRLYDRYLGPRWREEPADREVWGQADRIAPGELWRTHELRRERLVAFVRRSLRHQRERRGAPRSQVEAADQVLDPQALTIGFARRFATYKRATLLLRDTERLARILNDPERPAQVIYAGKAHPKDKAGKALIARIVELSRQEPFQRRIVFLEDYGMAAARYLVQGSDVWLNTPRRPREACGTSGMKAAANGVLNLSTLDGWWDEVYQPEFGWALGRGEEYAYTDEQDDIEAQALYNLLEQEVVPLFYQREADGLPHAWIERMKAAIGNLCPFVNAHRMVQEYTERFYLPTAKRYHHLTADDMAAANQLAAWKKRIREGWAGIRIDSVQAAPEADLKVGDTIQARVWVELGDLEPEDVRVEFYMGPLNVDGDIVEPEAVSLEHTQTDERGRHKFEAPAVPCHQSGRHGFSARVLPHHPDLISPFLPDLIVWAQS